MKVKIDVPAEAGQVLDDQHPRTLWHHALDLRAARAMTLRLLAHIDHRQRQPVGQKGGKRNARRLATRDAVELLEADFG